MNQSNPIQFGPFTILNPNTSRQGECDFSYPFLETLGNSGYKYSHSTIVGDMIYHSFFKEENDKIAGSYKDWDGLNGVDLFGYGGISSG